MKKISIIIILLSFLSINAQQVLVQGTFIRNYQTFQMQSVYAENSVALYKIRYKTNDIYGNLDTATGALVIPTNLPNCDSFPLINYNHGTVFEKHQVPSNSYELTAGQLFGSHQYVVTMPDYLGMGESRGIHPYQHADSEASATIDMMRAAREFCTQQNIQLNGQVFLTGYSQGGHAAMATHKYIQDSSLYNEFNIVSSIPMSGAYDMSITTANFIFNNTYDNPGYIVYLINSMQMVYGNLYDSIPQYYKAPYDNMVQEWLDGTRTLTSINNSFPDSIHKYLEDSIQTGFQTNPSHKLRIAIGKSDVYSWAPTRDIKMFYCEADDQVPYQNSIIALDTMTALGSTTVAAQSCGASLDHGGCVTPAFINGYAHVDAIARTCDPVGINENFLDKKITLFPNPVHNGIASYISDVAINKIEVYNTDSKLVWAKNMNGLTSFSINVESILTGVYFVKFTDTKGNTTTKKLNIQNN